MSPWPRPTSVPSGILIRPAVWPQYTEKWGGVPITAGEELGPHLIQCCLAKTYLRTTWHLDPSNRLAKTWVADYTDAGLCRQSLHP